jgi:hypothetical protein
MKIDELNKYLFGVAASGGLLLFLQPLWAYVFVCFVAIIIDCYSAWRLSVRIKIKFGRSTGKFQSNHAKRMVRTFGEIAGVLYLVFMMDKVIITMEQLYATKFIAGIFCTLQIISILENASSESDSKWMKPLQKILINKAERHFDVDIKTAINDDEETK